MRAWLAVVALCVASGLPACKEAGPDQVGKAGAKPAAGASNAALSASRGAVAGLLAGAADARYARALNARRFEFPADHGPHPDYRTEWWYFTGNLRTGTGRRFGFQLTLFRLALAPSQRPGGGSASGAPVPRTSRFATRQAWMGHFALADVDARSGGENREAGRFHAFERLERGAAGLAGASAQPFRVWLRDWQVRGAGQAGRELFPLQLRASENGVAVDLLLRRGKALLLQGDQGLSRKSGAPGNASYYYSYTRLPVSGRVRTADGEFTVTGLAWFDREWGTSALAHDQVGWDWFALQLDDGRDLMMYRLRTREGGTHPFSAGVLVSAEGASQPVALEQMHFEPGRTWRSADGEQYPVEWTVSAGALQLQVRALLDAQAHRGRFRYWEGAVQARGIDAGKPVRGRGYLEMTGY